MAKLPHFHHAMTGHKISNISLTQPEKQPEKPILKRIGRYIWTTYKSTLYNARNGPRHIPSRNLVLWKQPWTICNRPEYCIHRHLDRYHSPEHIQQQPWTLLYRPGQIHPKDPVPCKKQSWTLLYRPGHTWYNIRNSPGLFTTDLDIVFTDTWTYTTTPLDPSIQTWTYLVQYKKQPWVINNRPGHCIHRHLDIYHYRPGHIQQHHWTLLCKPGQIHLRTWYNIRNSPGPFYTHLDIYTQGPWYNIRDSPETLYSEADTTTAPHYIFVRDLRHNEYGKISILRVCGTNT